MAEPVAYWRLIAVLQSTVPLKPPLALRIYHAAVGLERARGGVEKLSGDLGMGEVRRLGKTLVLGAMSGPGFEADLDTPEGSGRVRFILTREGLDHEGLAAPDDDGAPALPRRPSLPN